MDLVEWFAGIGSIAFGVFLLVFLACLVCDVWGAE